MHTRTCEAASCPAALRSSQQGTPNARTFRAAAASLIAVVFASSIPHGRSMPPIGRSPGGTAAQITVTRVVAPDTVILTFAGAGVLVDATPTMLCWTDAASAAAPDQASLPEPRAIKAFLRRSVPGVSPADTASCRAATLLTFGLNGAAWSRICSELIASGLRDDLDADGAQDFPTFTAVFVI